MCKTLMPDDEPVKRCKKCGGVEFTESGYCRPCRREYDRYYRNAHKANIRNKNFNYRTKHPEKVKASLAAWEKANPDKKKELRVRGYQRKKFELLMGAMWRLKQLKNSNPNQQDNEQTERDTTN